MPYEAAQISKYFGMSVASRSLRWELRPALINGVPHASLCKMSKAGGTLHPSATWMIPVAEDVGVLYLDAPIGSGRSPTDCEQIQLRSIDATYGKARATWAIVPAGDGLLHHAEVLRNAVRRPEVVGRVFFVEPDGKVARPARSLQPVSRLSACDQQRLSLLF